MTWNSTTATSKQIHSRRISSATFTTIKCGKIITLGEQHAQDKERNCKISCHNFFRALNKKLRAEELLKLSKLPPSMAKREEVIKKKEALEELDASDAQPLTKNNVEFISPTNKKKKMRKKLRKTKSAIGPSRSQFSRSYVFDSKRDKDKASVKVSNQSLEQKN
jgi:hypothetical protein